MTPITFTVQIKTKNPLNQSWGHWATQAKKRNNERAAVLAKMPRLNLTPVFRVTLTRISKGTMDDDNLRATLKSVRDAVASRLGVDDRSALVKWEYEQAKGEPAVKVTIQGVYP